MLTDVITAVVMMMSVAWRPWLSGDTSTGDSGFSLSTHHRNHNIHFHNIIHRANTRNMFVKPKSRANSGWPAGGFFRVTPHL